MRLSLMMIVAVFASSCTAVTPDAGQEAVLVSKPYFFGNGGVLEKPVTTGRSYEWMSTSVIYVDVRPLQVNIEFNDLMSRDGVPLDFNAAIRYRVSNTVTLVSKFGADDHWFSRNLEQPFRNAVRDAVKRRGMNEMAIDASAAEAVDDEVSKATSAVIKRDSIPIELIDVTLGRANPPDAIKHQRIDTATQEQRINTEKQRTLAENQRLEAEKARAAADNGYRLAMSLSPEQYLQLKSIEAMSWACASKPGTCSFVTTGVMPTFGIR